MTDQFAAAVEVLDPGYAEAAAEFWAQYKAPAIPSRPRFAAECRMTYQKPHGGSMVRAAGYTVTAWQWPGESEWYRGQYETRDYAEAVEAARGYLFTGAASVMVGWSDGPYSVTEWWEAVQ